MGKYDFELELYNEDTISWIAARVADNSRVLEFGPANGRLTKYLKVSKNCSVDIVEIDQSSGEEAAQYAEIAFLGSEQGNIENYYWMKTTVKYDFIIFADVLEHLINPDEVLKRCKSVIKKDGVILVSVPNIAHNSVIIELMNDRFNYNPTGILDNTHLRFFTRQSFEKMALAAGWAITEEKAKNIRVSENEIKNSYEDVPKAIFKELAHRAQGDVYQYMFTLSLCESYLLGSVERIVSMDSSSYYFGEVQYERDGAYDYRKSVSRHFDPYCGYIDLQLQVFDKSSKALIKPLNVNCVLENIQIGVNIHGVYQAIPYISINGLHIGEVYFFVKNMPEIEIEIPENADRIFIQAKINGYDFDGSMQEMLEKQCKVFQHMQHESRERAEKIGQYENEIKRLSEYCRDEIKRLSETYENEIKMLNDTHKQELEKSSQIYETEIKRREQERLQLLEKIESRQRGNSFFATKKKQGEILFNKIRSKKVITPRQGVQNIQLKEPIRRVSAVIPNYNYARFLEERIDSIICQTYPVQEIIILDDCSTDDSIKVIQKRIAENQTGIPMKLIVNEKNSGSVFAQWQKAFQLAKGDYVWIAEADDSCNERFLEFVMKGFEDEEVVISYCESLTMDENNKLLMGDLRVWIDIFNTGKWNNSYIKDGKEEVAETMCINNTIANVSSAVIKNGDYYEILEKAKEYKLAGDWYAYMNILMKGKIAYFKDSLNYHRMQAQGLTLSTSHEKEFDEIIKLQNFALNNFNISEEVRKKVYERREKERIRFGL